MNSKPTPAPRYPIGDRVTVPDDFCPGCMTRTGLMTGQIVEYQSPGDVSALMDLPGPYYLVSVDHDHNANGRLVYAESELSAGHE